MRECRWFSGILAFSALGATRTRDPLLRKQVLYPLSYEGHEKLAFRSCEEAEGRRSNPQETEGSASLAVVILESIVTRTLQVQGGEGGI